MTTLTDDLLITALRDTVAEKGRDWVYDHSILPFEDADSTACWYVTEDGQPLCIVGHAINRIDPDELPEASDSSSVTALLAYKRDVSMKVRYAYYVAQRCQDQDLPWGVALDAAERVLATEEDVYYGGTTGFWSGIADEILLDVFKQHGTADTMLGVQAPF